MYLMSKGGGGHVPPPPHPSLRPPASAAHETPTVRANYHPIFGQGGGLLVMFAPERSPTAEYIGLTSFCDNYMNIVVY